MPITAPTDATYQRVSYRFIDDSGDKRTTSYRAPLATTVAEIQALGVALGAATSANLYEIAIESVYAANPAASAALDGEQNSVYENINILYKEVSSGRSTTVFIPAPLESLMVGDTDNVNVSSALFTAVRDTADAVLNGDFAPISARYTERREINDSVSIS